MAQLLSFIFSVGGLVTCTLGFALYLVARPSSRVARIGLLLVAVFYFGASLYGVGYALKQPLVRGYRPLTAADVPRGRTAIVLLGSSAFTARDWDGGEHTAISSIAAERAREAFRIYTLGGADWVTTSGGPLDPADRNVPTGVANRLALIGLGVAEERIQTLAYPRTTYEEAEAIKVVLQRVGAEHVVLVTSSGHMRRAAGAFRAVGLTVIPAIARDTSLDSSWEDWWLPSDDGLRETGSVAHEYLGIVGYLIQGRFKF